MTIASIYRKITSKITGKDVQKIQSDIIDSLEREVQKLRMDVVHAEQEASRLETALSKAATARNNKIKDCEILQSRVDSLVAERTGLQTDLRNLRNKPDVVAVEKQFVMTQQVFDSFERSLEAPILNNNVTPHGAGYLLGIQRALTMMRQRFVPNN